MENPNFVTDLGNKITKTRRYWGYSDEEKQAIVNDYHSGLTYNELRLKYGVASATVVQMVSETPPTVESVRKRHGVKCGIKVETVDKPQRRKKWTDEEKQAIVNDWASGFSYTQLYNKYGCSAGVVSYAAKKFIPTVPNLRAKIQDNKNNKENRPLANTTTIKLRTKDDYWTPQEKQALVNDYASGMSYGEIRDKYNCNPGVVAYFKNEIEPTVPYYWESSDVGKESSPLSSVDSCTIETENISDGLDKAVASLEIALSELKNVSALLKQREEERIKGLELKDILQRLIEVVA